jgi:hypothetical protein
MLRRGDWTGSPANSSCSPTHGCVLLLFVTQTASLAPADRLALIIEGLCQAIARRCGLTGLAGPLIILIWTRLRRTAARFTRALLAEGAGISPSRPQAVMAAPDEARGKPSRARPKSPLPRRKAWLLRLAPETASAASQFRHFLADPEVAALLADAPHLARILRPLCHALGIRAAGPGAAGSGAAGIRANQAPPPPLPLPDPAPPARMPAAPPWLPFRQHHALPEPIATPLALA